MADTQTITLSDVAVTLALGVGDAERRRPQAVLVTVALTLADATAHDDLGDTIDYDRVIHFLRDTLPAGGPLHLIETVADHVADHVLSLSARVATVVVTVKKPSVLTAPAMVSVTLTRHAENRR